MKTFRRVTHSITASLNWMISQVENHEGLVNAAISEIQEAGARAHVQLKRVKSDGQLMRKRLGDLRDQRALWEERARKVAPVDEGRALECMKRRKRLEREIVELEIQEREHAQVEKQLAQDLSLIQERLGRLKQQRNVMRTRQSRAEALKTLQAEDGNTISEIDEIFERWDHKITEYEGMGAPNSIEDDFVEQFTTQEEQEELRADLSQLMSNH